MNTLIVPLSSDSLKLPSRITDPRTMPHSTFIERHASGTLRDNHALGFVWSIQCLAERVAYTFGYGFSPFKSHLVVFNDSISECDEPAYTLSGRWFKAYLCRNLFPEDYFEIKYVIIKNEDGSKSWEGIGIIVRQTSATFIPDSTLIVARICQYHPHLQRWDSPIPFA